MKVLEQIQNVTARDIPRFVDWLKTVRVEYHGDRNNREFTDLKSLDLLMLVSSFCWVIERQIKFVCFFKCGNKVTCVQG